MTIVELSHRALPPEAENSDAFVHSLGRGLSVIRAFAAGRERLTIAQVAGASGLDRAGARRILFTLHALGYVGMDGRLFYLTSRVRDLGRGYLAQPLWEVTYPELRRMADTLNETVSAGVLDGGEVVYTVRVRSPRIIQLELAPGARIPAHASSMGQVLLAALSPIEVGAYLRQATLQPLSDTTLTTADALRRRLDHIRQQGWCAAHGEFEPGTTGVSAPVVDAEGRTLAALNVSLSRERAAPAVVEGQIVPLLKRAAIAIAERL